MFFFSQFRAIGPDDRPNYKNWNVSCNMYSRYFKTSPSQMTLFAPFFLYRLPICTFM